MDTAENLADMMTKVLAREPFEYLRVLVMQIMRLGVTFSHLMSPEARRRHAAKA